MKSRKFVLPTLYCHNKAGKVKQWNIEVINDVVPIIQSSAGLVDGKKQVDKVEVEDGKNIGRANETTPWAQACFEAESKWKKKLDKGYTEEELDEVGKGEGQNEGKYPLPMLAKKYLEELPNIEFPVIAQNKLNGIRCRTGIIDGEFVMWSRASKPMPVVMEKFKAALMPILKMLNAQYPNAHLDGELFCRGIPLQTINSGVKAKNEITDKLEYHIYDIAEPSLEQNIRDEARIALLAGLPKDSIIVCVPSVVCYNDEEVQKELNRAIKEKYEGLIIRLFNGGVSKYLNRHRSDALLKLKKFYDKEYSIIGGKTGKGRYKGAVVFQCITEKGSVFEVTPIGTMEQRRSWYNELDTFIGKQITIRYQEFSKDDIPTILTGLDAAVIREFS